MRIVHSAGGAITRTVDGQLQLLVVDGQRNQKYGFPKGHVEAGETYEQAALREVAEETGLRNLHIGKEIGTIIRKTKERNGELVTKHIHVFHMTTDDYEHGPAEEAHAWIPLENAVEQFSRKQDIAFLRDHLEELR